MRYRIEELSSATETSVDTIRYYQHLKLLAPPARQGRVGLYDQSHLRRLREVRELSQRGFTLEQIRELDNPDPLLRALVAKTRTAKSYTPAQLARICGLDLRLVEAAVEAGLIRPKTLDGTGRAASTARATSTAKAASAASAAKFGQEAVEMLSAAAALIDSGVAAEGLLDLAQEHARHTQSSAQKAVRLFAAAARDKNLSKSEIAQQLEHLLPLVVKLIATHFSQTLLEHSTNLVQEGAEDHGRDEA